MNIILGIALFLAGVVVGVILTSCAVAAGRGEEGHP